MTIKLIFVLMLSIVFLGLSGFSFFFHSKVLARFIVGLGVPLILLTFFYFWHLPWKNKLGRIIFSQPVWKGFYMHFLLLFTGAAGIILAGGGANYNTMGNCVVRMMLPMFAIYGWEAGNPSGWLAILIFSFATVLFLINGVFNFGSALVPSIAKFFNRRKKVNYKNHIVVWGCNTHLDEVIEQMTCSVLGKERRPIVILSDLNFIDEANSIAQRYLEKWNEIEVIQGTALNVDDLKNAKAKSAMAVLLLPPEKEENPDLTVSLAAMTVWDFFADIDVKVRPRVIVKVDDPLFASRIRHVADKVICASRRDFLLAAEAVFFPVVIDVYSDLMKISEDTNEIYVEKIPQLYAGKTYTELATAILTASRNTENPATVIGIMRDDELFLNPSQSKLDTLIENDKVLVISMENLNIENLLEKLD